MANKLNAEDFLKQITPSKKGSKLQFFWDDIQILRKNGCSLEQVKEFLKKNNIEITVAGLSKALKKRAEKNEVFSIPSTTTKPPPESADILGQDAASAASKDEEVDYEALAAGLKTEKTGNGFMVMPGEPVIQTGKAGSKDTK